MRNLIQVERAGRRVGPYEVRRQRGQILPLFLLILVALILTCGLAATIGQGVVRRLQAQSIADHAAFTGATLQAAGLNKIAYERERQFKLLQTIQYGNMVIGFMDNYDTMLDYGTLLNLGITRVTDFVPPISVVSHDDWGDDKIEGMDTWFGISRGYVDLVNQLYMSSDVVTGTAGVMIPSYWARKEAEAALESVFGEEYSSSPDSFEITMDNTAELTDLDTEEYEVTWFYGPSPIALAEWASDGGSCADSYGLNIYACGRAAAGGVAMLKYQLYQRLANKDLIWSDPYSYEYTLTSPRQNPDSSLVSFNVKLTIPGTDPVLGSPFIQPLPAITVVAAAKPFHGTVGDVFEKTDVEFPAIGKEYNSWFYKQADGKEIAHTYHAKLVKTEPGLTIGFPAPPH